MTPELFTPDDLAQMFSTTRSQIYKLRLAQSWPHHLLGGSIRFSREDIDAILALTAKKPEPARTKRTRRTR